MLNWIKTLFPKNPRPPVRRTILRLEPIEDRLLPSVSVTLSPVTHLLTINGAASADQVQAGTSGKDIKLTVNGHSYSYLKSAVKLIDADVGNGKDKIVNNTGIQVTVNQSAKSTVTVEGKEVVALNGVNTTSSTTSGSILTAFLTGTSGAFGDVTGIFGGTSISVVVSGLTDSATYTFDVGTTAVGTFTTDASGTAIVTFDNLTASLTSGTAVSVVDVNGNTDLSGALFSFPQGGGGQGCNGGALTASLTGTTSGETGQVTALPSRGNSGDYDLQVIVSGLAANTTYTLEIGTTSVGEFITGSTGAANITLNDVAATIASSTAVSIVDANGNADLSGTFAAPMSQGGSFSSTLASTTSGETGQVTALPTPTSGEFNLQVVVSGLVANATFTLEIGPTSVGTFSTNSLGAVNITLNDVKVTIASGMAVSIVDANGNTDLTGTFAASTSTGGWHGWGGGGGGWGGGGWGGGGCGGGGGGGSGGTSGGAGKTTGNGTGGGTTSRLGGRFGGSAGSVGVSVGHHATH